VPRAGLIGRLLNRCVTSLRRTAVPRSGGVGVVRGLLADVVRSKKELLAENAMLRQQLVVAARRLKCARFKARDRIILVALSTLFARWREALPLVKPETVLRWLLV
jgi:hypothetical protein